MIQLSARAASSQARIVFVFQHRRDIGAGSLAQLRAVGPEPQHHRRVHGIGHAVLAEQPGAVGTEAPAAVAPELLDARDVGRAFGSARDVRRPSARAFMGHCERRMPKPACISALTARATARAARSRGQPRPASSQAYSQIARESHTSTSPCSSTGTRRVGLTVATSRTNSAVSSGIRRSVNARPRCFIRIHGTQRPRRIVLVANRQ